MPSAVQSNSLSEGGRPVRFARLKHGFDSPIHDSLRLAAVTPADWDDVLARVEEDFGRPDFSRQTGILVALGRITAQSRWITIDSLRASNGRLKAFVRKSAYAGFCPVASSISAPVDLIVADTAGLVVEFVEASVTTEDCLNRRFPFE
jgi:hypothetical protein